MREKEKKEKIVIKGLEIERGEIKEEVRIGPSRKEGLVVYWDEKCGKRENKGVG